MNEDGYNPLPAPDILLKEMLEIKAKLKEKNFYATMQQYMDMLGLRAFTQQEVSIAAQTDFRIQNVRGYVNSININTSSATTSISIFLSNNPLPVFQTFSEKDVSFQLNKFMDGDIVVRINPAGAGTTTGIVVCDYYNTKQLDIAKLI